MMDILDDIADYLESKLNLFTYIKVDVLSDDPDAICIRSSPSTPSMRFIDNTKDNVISFQMLVKNQSQSLSKSTLKEITRELEKLTPIDFINKEYEFIKCELYVNLTLADITKDNSFTYTALFNATIYEK